MASVVIYPKIKYDNFPNLSGPCFSSEIYLVGGRGKLVELKTIEKYNVAEDRWTELKI